MNFKDQLKGVNDFLEDTYKKGTRLSTLLANLGFEQEQIELLRVHHLESLVIKFIALIQNTLDDERLFEIVVRRYGLDGDIPDTLQAIGEKLGVSRERIRQLLVKALKKCRYQKQLQTELAVIASEYLGLVKQFESNKPNPEQSQDNFEQPRTTTPDLVIDKLNQLAEIRNIIQTIQFEYETKREAILNTVQIELDNLQVEYVPLLTEMEQRFNNLELEIKRDVLLQGTTIQNAYYRVTYTKGYAKWDTKGLNQYSKIDPQILQFRKMGKPAVRIYTIRPK